MSQMLFNTLRKVPMPIFGNASLTTAFVLQKAKAAPRFAKLGAVGGAFAGWFIWPAITDEFKVDIGLLPDPEAEAAKAEAAKVMSAEVVLDKDKVSSAHIPEVKKVSKERMQELEKEKMGDFTHLEAEWDKFMDAAINGDEDDDDDEDDEDDEEEEEEEEEAGGDAEEEDDEE